MTLYGNTLSAIATQINAYESMNFNRGKPVARQALTRSADSTHSVPEQY